MPGTHSQGAYGQLLIEPGQSPHTFDANSIPIEFLAETIVGRQRIIGGQGIRGTLCDCAERTRQGIKIIRGEIRMYVSPNLLDQILVDVMGFTEAPVDIFTTNDTLPYFGILLDVDMGASGKVIEFQDCKLDYWVLHSKAPLSGDRGQPDMVYLVLGIVGTNYGPGVWPVAPPALPTAPEDAPYIFQDTDNATGITLNGAVREVEEFVIRMSYANDVKYTNGLCPHSIRPRARILQTRFRVPLDTTTADLCNVPVAGGPATIRFENGNLSTQLDFANIQIPPTGPIIAAKDQVSLLVNGIARCTATTEQLVITNDNTP